jgi:hypothetical protein
MDDQNKYRDSLCLVFMMEQASLKRASTWWASPFVTCCRTGRATRHASAAPCTPALHTTHAQPKKKCVNPPTQALPCAVGTCKSSGDVGVELGAGFDERHWASRVQAHLARQRGALLRRHLATLRIALPVVHLMRVHVALVPCVVVVAQNNSSGHVACWGVHEFVCCVPTRMAL